MPHLSQSVGSSSCRPTLRSSKTLWAFFKSSSAYMHTDMAHMFKRKLRWLYQQFYGFGNCIHNIFKKQIVMHKQKILLLSSSHSSWLKPAGSRDGALHCHSQLTSCFSLRHVSGGRENTCGYYGYPSAECVDDDRDLNDPSLKTNSAWVKLHWHLEIWELSQICFQCVDGRVYQLLMEVLPQSITVLQRRQNSHQPD